MALARLLSYQPYIFSDTFAVGAGLSIIAGHLKDPPAVYCPDATADDTDPTFFAAEFAKESQREEFFSANDAYAALLRRHGRSNSSRRGTA